MYEKKIASLRTRALGGAIDIAILLALAFVVCFIWANNANPIEAYLSKEESKTLWQSRFILIWLFIELVYSVGFMTSDMQATLGQKAVGIKVVKDNGEKIEYGAAIGRYLISIISSILLKIGYLMAFAREDKKTLHDLVAGTLVIESGTSFEPTISNYEQPTKTRTSSVEIKSTEKFTKDTTKPNFHNFKNNIKNDDDFWAMALEEFESTSRIKGLYAKLYAQHDGNEQQIKSQYIKERFKQLSEHQETKIKKDVLEKENNDFGKEVKSDLESLENNYKKITSIKLVGDTEFYKFQDGRVAIKANKTEYVLYADFKSAENALNYSNLYGSIGFIRLITINNGKVVISCPKCKTPTRVPANKELEIICPSCTFEWREKT
jgi:uncharacterized RDD family membrane protein YckC